MLAWIRSRSASGMPGPVSEMARTTAATETPSHIPRHDVAPNGDVASVYQGQVHRWREGVVTQLAHEKKVPCFCADLTVNPILVDWNKNVAARLSPFANIGIGLQETNGPQYYKNWDKIMAYHPRANASWIKTRDGVYITDKSFYEQSGGIFYPSEHYEKMFSHEVQ